jgi:mono/diheme cytochrome c family protein
MRGLTVIAALAALSAASAAVAAEAPSAQVRRGQAIYDRIGCWACHGYSGQGGSGPMSGPRLSRPDLSVAALTAIARHPFRLMPPYGPGVVSDAELADISAFLQSRPAPRPASAIPLLSSSPN